MKLKEDKTLVQVYIPRDARTHLRVLSAAKGETMAETADRIIEAAFEKEMGIPAKKYFVEGE